MKARITYVHPETNSGKLQKLEELHVEYCKYVQVCLDTMIQAKCFSLNWSQFKAFFPPSEVLSSHIKKTAQSQASNMMKTWVLSLYARKLRSKILREDLPDEAKMALRTTGKYALAQGGQFGRGVISQEWVDLYHSWVWDLEISGNPPKTSSRTPMLMTEMTCVFSKAESEESFKDCWWLRFSSLTRRSCVSVPLKATPYLKDPKGIALSVLVRKDRKNRWVFQFTDKAETSLMAGDQGITGIDVGFNVVAATSDGRLYGADIKPKFNALYAKVKDLRANRQRQGLLENSPRLDALEQKLSGLVKTATGTVANRLVKDFPGHTFVLEDLDLRGCRGQKRFAYRALQQSLEHKATVIKVNPAYTSQMCPSCGYVHRGNRSGVKFHCRACGRKSHADVVGGINLLGRSKDKQVNLSTPPYLVKATLTKRYLDSRGSSLGSTNALVSTSRRLTVEVPQGICIALNRALAKPRKRKLSKA